MKYCFLFIFVLSSLPGLAQPKGKVVIRNFIAEAISHNPGGEDPNRRLTIYLPPGYDDSKKHYPVIYFLHGFTRTDSFYMAAFHLDSLLDSAIAKGVIRPVIMVLPNTYTRFQGSFYTNSELTGNWSDFISRDVVDFIDRNFRTIKDRRARGLCGHSMGGNGTIKIGMLHSEVFSALYALSPARLDWGEGLVTNPVSYSVISHAKTQQDIAKDFFAMEITDIARTYSPNTGKPPFDADFPFELIGDSIRKNEAVFKKWDAQFPINMIDAHMANLKSLTAIKLDWGRNDQFPFIPVACLKFSKKLETMNIPHFAEEYIGDHRNMLGGTTGRIYTELLPFFDAYLRFEGK